MSAVKTETVTPKVPLKTATGFTAEDLERVCSITGLSLSEVQEKLTPAQILKIAGDHRSNSEIKGEIYADHLVCYIHDKGGLYLRDEDGLLYVILTTAKEKNARIPLNWDPTNIPQATLMQTALGVSTLEKPAQIALQRLASIANQAAGAGKLRQFSAMSEDAEQLYLPIDGCQLLQINSSLVEPVANGKNAVHLWIEHPYHEPLKYSPTVDVKAGLDLFEQLCVVTQACEHPDMRWLVAMQEGLFPYLRDSEPARFIAQHIGPKGSGKTSGAKRFTLLNGLGNVKGDCTVAAFSDLGDIGLLVADNKEHANFTRPLIDFFLFLATGADRGRSSPTGKVRSSGKGRPVGVITTIEGVFTPELQDRVVSIPYAKQVGPPFDQAKNEREILKYRHEMLSAFIPVFRRYLQIRKEERPTPVPRPRFQGNFQAIADLLRAYADVAEKPESWAERIIASWNSLLTSIQPEEESELEFLIQQVVDGWENNWASSLYGMKRILNVNVEGVKGDLYVTKYGVLLDELKKRNPNNHSLPRSPQGLRDRLHSDCGEFQSLRILDANSAPDFEALKRNKRSKSPLGIFVPDDQDDQQKAVVTPVVTELSPGVPAPYRN